VVPIILMLVATSGVNSLLLPASPLGVTTSFSSSNDAEALFYNPAHFESGENYRLWCSYNRFYLSMQSVSMALTKKIKSVHIGIGIINFDYGDIELRPDYPTEDSVTYYSAHDFMIAIGGNVYITPEGKFGLILKYVSENIYTYSDYALAVDVSFSYRLGNAGISFGASNFGSRITLRNEAVNLPARLSIGGFFGVRKFMLSTDVHYLVNNGVFEFSVGGGYSIHPLITVNATAHYREEFYPGFGLNIVPGKFTIKYAGSFYPKNLGFVNTFGIGFDF
jgi:hypothetical protein